MIGEEGGEQLQANVSASGAGRLGAAWWRREGELVRARSERWWRRGAWQWAKWARRRGMDRWLQAVDTKHAADFYRPGAAGHPVVYAWGRADGRGEKVYIGSTIRPCFVGDGRPERFFEHLQHAERHRLNQCKCTSHLYATAGGSDSRALTQWVFIPLVVLPGATATELQRVEHRLIVNLQPRLNTVGVTWSGRRARKPRRPRRRPSRREGCTTRRQSSRRACTSENDAAAQPLTGTVLRWRCATANSVGPTLRRFLDLVVDAEGDRQVEPGATATWSGGGRGCITADQWRNVTRRWGATGVAIYTRTQTVWRGRLADAWPSIRDQAEGVLRITAVHENKTRLRQQQHHREASAICDSIVNREFSVMGRVHSAPDGLLAALWSRTQKHQQLGAWARRRIDKIVVTTMWRRHKLRVRRTYVAGLPAQATGRVRALLRRLIMERLKQLQLPQGWRSVISRSLQIPQRRRRNVGELLDNHRKFAAAFDSETRFQCTCHDHPIWEHWGGQRPMGAHVQFLLSECTDPTMKRVSAVGSNFVPHPGTVLLRREVQQPVRDVGHQLFADQHALLRGWGQHGREQLQHLVRTAATLDAGARPQHRPVSRADVEYVRGLTRGLVISPVDRNLKDRIIECPAAYWAGHRATFCESDHYIARPGGERRERAILSQWRQIYQTNGWTKYARMRAEKTSSVPGVAYSLVKMKDLCADSKHAANPRRRPLTPYSGHPMQKLMQMCGAVLSCALKTAGLRSWGFHRVDQFVDRASDMWRQLRSQAGERDRIRVFPFDVKSMFTELPKPAVLEATTWLLTQHPLWKEQRLSLGRRRRAYPTTAWVHRTSTGKYQARVRPGLGRGKQSEVGIPLAVVLDVVKFDLDHSWMKCGVHLLQQRRGIPMGSYLSAILAGITVSVAEDRFYQRLPPQVAARMGGTRFADDGLVAILEREDSTWTAEEVYKLVEDECFPDPLQLEREDHDGQFKLLESTVCISNRDVFLTHRSRLWDEWRKTGSSRNRVWTARGSWGARRSGILTGTLLRAATNCSCRPRGSMGWWLVVSTLLAVIVEAMAWGNYTYREVRRVTTLLAKRDDDRRKVWPILDVLVRRGRDVDATHRTLTQLILWLGIGSRYCDVGALVAMVRTAAQKSAAECWACLDH